MSQRASFWRSTLTDLAIMTVIGVFLAIIGPFGSIEQPLAIRLLTWLLFSYIGYAIYSPMGFLVDRAHAAMDLPKAPLWLAATLIATVPMTVVIFVIQYLPNRPPVPQLDDALLSYFYVFAIGGGITLLFNVIGAGSFRAASEPAGKPPQTASHVQPSPANLDTEPSNPLLDELPPELGSEIIALEMEDHYVRVHTVLGSELVLMRLRDAMLHVAQIDGRQVHRSWWVARLAVDDVRRDGRNVRLVLASKGAGGVEAPVSRAQVSELKAAGWF